MLKTYEAVLQPNGNLEFLEQPQQQRKTACRVLVTFTEPDTALCGAMLSEQALAGDWLSEEEDAAWAHLQVAK
jgi:hypothetical protein